MTIQTPFSVEDFEAFVEREENADKLFEFIGGQIIEVPSNTYVSAIAALIAFYVRLFLREHGLQGQVTGAAGGYIIAGEHYAPDVAYISAAKQPEPWKSGYNPVPPDLAVEVVSSDRADEAHRLRIKVTNYLLEGVTVWVVRPEDKVIEVHAPGQPVKLYREADTLDGGAVLPEFALPVAEVFQVM